MTIYFIAALLPALFEFIFEYTGSATISPKSRRNRIRIYMLICSIPMFMILGLRAHSIGTDTIQYVAHFRNVSRLSFSEALNYSNKDEPMLYLLMYFTSRISDDPSLFLCLVALIMVLCFFAFVDDSDDGELLATFFHITLGTFFFLITGMRQGLAISFCLFSVRFVKKRKLIPFALLMALSFFTHRSSIMFAVVYFISNCKLSFYNFALLALASLIFIMFIESFQSWFNDAIEYDYDMEATGNGGIFLMVVILMNVLSLTMSKAVLEKYPDTLILYNINFIALVLWIARLFTRTAERPSYYFLPATFVITAISIHEIKRPHVKLMVTLVVACLCCILMYHRLSSAVSMNPFIFFWEK